MARRNPKNKTWIVTINRTEYYMAKVPIKAKTEAAARDKAANVLQRGAIGANEFEFIEADASIYSVEPPDGYSSPIYLPEEDEE